jgi:hypothetical protein
VVQLHTDGIRGTSGDTRVMLQKIVHDWPCMVTGSACSDSGHCLDIEIFYNEIVHCLTEASELFIPLIPRSALKHYWSTDQ